MHSPICAMVSGCFGTLRERKKGKRPRVPAPSDQCIIYNLASTASYPIAVMEAPTTAELTAFCGVRNPPTAAVTHAHRDPALRVVRAAVLIYKDKDR
ncbi:hypothetical protein NQZ68_017629 [Dissostichus eleginoides]|nr:hypothetical protein NQZ68_017629 [Dissostichus eleginoides]